MCGLVFLYSNSFPDASLNLHYYFSLVFDAFSNSLVTSTPWRHTLSDSGAPECDRSNASALYIIVVVRYLKAVLPAAPLMLQLHDT